MADVARVLNRIARGFGIFLAISCMATLIFAAYRFRVVREFQQGAVELRGTVTSLSRRTEITFGYDLGPEHTFSSVSRKHYKLGTTVPVLYNPQKNQAEVKSFTTLWMMPMAVAIVGFFQLAAGLFLLYGVPHIFRTADKLEAKATLQ